MSAYIVDTETTNRKPPLEIIEAAWIKLPMAADLTGDDPDLIPDLGPVNLYRAVLNRYCERFKPSVPITFGSMAVHHILPQELENCRPSAEFQLPDDCTYICGHSIDFDWQAIGCPQVKRICTHAMAQHVYPDATGYSQSALIYMLEGTHDHVRQMLRQAHGAGADVQMNALLLWHILKDMPTPINRWSALWEFSEECRIPRTCPMKRYEGVPLAELDLGFVDWCLAQHWLDPYFRKGLERVVKQREAAYYAQTDTDRDEEREDVPW